MHLTIPEGETIALDESGNYVFETQTAFSYFKCFKKTSSEIQLEKDSSYHLTNTGETRTHYSNKGSSTK